MQNTKRITNTAWGEGFGGSIHCGLQGQALLTASHSHPEFSKIQIAKIYNPSGLLTHKKYQVPNKPRVRRRLENQGQSRGKSQVKTGREQTEAGGEEECFKQEIASAKPLWQKGTYLKNLKRGAQIARQGSSGVKPQKEL